MNTLFDKAVAFHQSGNLILAEKNYISVLKKENNKSCHYLLGLLYSQKKQFLLAIKHLESAIPFNHTDGNLANALAICYQKTGKHKTAIRLINIAISQNPKNASYCNRKTKILLSDKQLQKAKTNTLNCIKQFPKFAPAYHTSFNVCNKLSRPDIALKIMRRGNKNIPNNPEILFNLAQAYLNITSYEKAKAIFTMLAQHDFKREECLNNLGIIERERGNIKEAEKKFRQAISLGNNNPVTLWNLSLLLLLKGNFRPAWKIYDTRLLVWKKTTCFNTIQTWNGEELDNKSILVLSEQGIGDQILFAHTFNALINMAKKVTIECDLKLHRIFQRSFPKANIIKPIPRKTVHKKMTMDDSHDYKIYSGSILQHLNQNITPSAFLIAKKTNFKCLKNKPNIGFSWKGATNFKDVKKRSTHIRDWASLLSHTDYHFYCLQHNISTEDKHRLQSISENIIFPDNINNENNIETLAEIISQLDLVISVTNTNVHLAGSMGINTWCLTPYSPDWPWGLHENKCKWYASVTLFRQQNNNWKPVFENIENKLKSI